MELQFVFGNPTKKGKKKSKARKSATRKKGKGMAKKKRRPKKAPKAKKKASRRPAKAAKKKAHKRKASRKLKRKKNPYVYVAKKKGEKAVRSETAYTSGEKKMMRGKILGYDQQRKIHASSAQAGGAGADQWKRYEALVEAFKKRMSEADAKEKAAEQFKKEMKEKGFKVSKKILEVGGQTVAKKKKKKSSKKKAAKKSSKKAARRKKSGSKKKASRRKRRSAKKVSVRHKMGKRSDTVTAKIPKLKKGQSAKKKYKSRKRRFSFMVKRTNPIFGSPRAAMNVVDKHFQTATGHDLVEAGLLFGAGAALPVIESLLMKVPGVDQVKSQLGKFGPQVAGMSSSLVTILGLGALHYAIEKVPALSKAKKAEPALRALIAASVVKAGSSLSSIVANAVGMSGVDFTPMSGVSFTPMSGVNYTSDMRGAPQLGSAPQMGYGADFGRGYDVADYGGGGGYTEDRKFSKADFGYEDEADDEPTLDQSSGVMG